MYKHDCNPCDPRPVDPCAPRPDSGWCPPPDMPKFCPPPAHPPMPCCPPSPSVVEGQSLYEAVNHLTDKVNCCITTYNDVMRNCYQTLHNLQRAAEENGAYYGPCEVRVETGYYAEESATYQITRKANVDRNGKPIRVDLHLAYGNTTNSKITQDIFSASKITYADKIFTAIPQGENGWYGNVIWHGAPLPTDTTKTNLYTVGFTRCGLMKVYANTATTNQMLYDTVENAMGCSGVLIQNGQITDDSYQSNIPYRTQQGQRVVMGQNTDNREVFWLTCGSSNSQNDAGLTSKACAQILLGYGCDIAVELTEGDSAGAADKGALMFTPANNTVPEVYCYWVISRKCFYKNDFERELAELTQNYGRLIWEQQLMKGDVQNKFENIQEQIENITNLYNQLSAKLEVEIQNREEADKNLQNQIDTINTEIEAINANIEKIEQDIADLEATIQAQIDAINTEIDNIKLTITTIQQDIKDLESELAKQDSLIATIQKTITYLETALTEVKTTIEEFRTELREVKETLDQIQSGVLVLPYLPIAGGTMEGDIVMDGHKITGLPEPTVSSDAVTKEYVDRISPGTIGHASKDAYGVVKIGDGINVQGGVISVTDGGGGGEGYLPLAGGTMDADANITMQGTGTIKGVPNPTADTDAANKAYVDNAVESVEFTLPVASSDTLGGIMVGEGLTITPEGVLSATGGSEPPDTYLPLAGGTMNENANIFMNGTGTIKSVPAPTADSDVANKKYVDDAVAGEVSGNYLSLNGGTMNKDATIGYTDSLTIGDATHGFVVSATSTSMHGADVTLESTGNIEFDQNGKAVTIFENQFSMGARQITGVVDPTNDTDAATKHYVDSQIASAGEGEFLPLAGGTMESGANIALTSSGRIGTNSNYINVNDTQSARLTLNSDSSIRINPGSLSYSFGTGGASFANQKIANVADPTSDQDAATKAYVDAQVASAGEGEYLPLAGGTMDANAVITMQNGRINGGTENNNGPSIALGTQNLSLYSYSTTGTAVSPVTISNTEMNQNNRKITNVTDPTANQDAATKAYVDNMVATAGQGEYLPLSGGTMDANAIITPTTKLTIGDDIGKIEYQPTYGLTLTGTNIAFSSKTGSNMILQQTELVMGNRNISDVLDPTEPQQVATKAYVDAHSGGGVPTSTIIMPSVFVDPIGVETTPYSANFFEYYKTGQKIQGSTTYDIYKVSFQIGATVSTARYHFSIPFTCAEPEGDYVIDPSPQYVYATASNGTYIQPKAIGTIYFARWSAGTFDVEVIFSSQLAVGDRINIRTGT